MNHIYNLHIPIRQSIDYVFAFGPFDYYIISYILIKSPHLFFTTLNFYEDKPKYYKDK